MKKLFALLGLVAACSAFGAGKISDMTQTNLTAPTLTLLELAVPSGGGYVTRSITLSNLMNAFKALGFTTNINVTNLTAYADSVTNVPLKIQISTGNITNSFQIVGSNGVPRIYAGSNGMTWTASKLVANSSGASVSDIPVEITPLTGSTNNSFQVNGTNGTPSIVVRSNSAALWLGPAPVSDIEAISGGNVGLIVLKDTSVNDAVVIGSGSSSAASAANIGLYRTRKSDFTADTIVQSGDKLAHIAAYGSDGTSYRRAASIQMHVDGTPGATDMPGRIGLFTTTDGTATEVERVRIDNTGQIQVTNDLLIAGNALISSNLFIRSFVTTNSQATTNWVLNWNRQEVEVPSSAITNETWLMHTTNGPAAGSGTNTFFTYTIQTGNTNRFFYLPSAEFANHVYDTNVLTFMFPSNATVELKFKKMTGVISGSYMYYPKVAL